VENKEVNPPLLFKYKLSPMRENKTQQRQIWAMLCHLSALLWIPLASLIILGIPLYLPFFNVLGPLIIWQLKKKQDPWIDFQGKESLNFQLSLIIYSLGFIIVCLFLLFVTSVIVFNVNGFGSQFLDLLMGIFNFLWVFIGFIFLFQLGLVIFAATKAYKGQHYRYPFTIRFLR
jgi:hypothetical protein